MAAILVGSQAIGATFPGFSTPIGASAAIFVDLKAKLSLALTAIATLEASLIAARRRVYTVGVNLRNRRLPIDTPRCSLRPFIAEDADWLSDLVADPEVNRFTWECITGRDRARRAAEAMVWLDLNRFHFGHWAIQDRNTGVIHGWAALGKLRPWSGPSDEIAVSYVLRRASWGHGLATEAARHLIHHGFASLDLEKIMAVVLAGNIASTRVLEKVGMHFVRSSVSADGKTLQYYAIDLG